AVPGGRADRLRAGACLGRAPPRPVLERAFSRPPHPGRDALLAPRLESDRRDRARRGPRGARRPGLDAHLPRPAGRRGRAPRVLHRPRPELQPGASLPLRRRRGGSRRGEEQLEPPVPLGPRQDARDERAGRRAPDGAPGQVAGAVGSTPTTAIPFCTGTYILPSTIAGPPPPGVAAAGSPTVASSSGLRLVVPGVTGTSIPESIRTTSSRVPVGMKNMPLAAAPSPKLAPSELEAHLKSPLQASMANAFTSSPGSGPSGSAAEAARVRPEITPPAASKPPPRLP